MDPDKLLIAALIVVARIGDVSLGTMRTLCVVQGRAITAWVLGFFEILIWLFAVSSVLTNLDDPIYVVAYALGYASGTYVGIKIENWFAFGYQVVRVFTRLGDEVTVQLRSGGFNVTSFDGVGRDGAVNLLFIETRRKQTPRLLRAAADADPACFYMVDDIRLAAQPAPVKPLVTGWRSVIKRK